MLGILLAGQVVLAGQELAIALKETPAPEFEFIRTQAKYILKKLEKTASSSGKPELATFTIDNQLPESGEIKVSINLTGMNLLDAIQAVAKAVGAGADFQESHVVLKDADEVEQLILPEEPVAPVIASVEDAEPAKKTKAAKVKEERISFGDISTALVFIESAEGRGSGFIAEDEGKIYLFTNQHNFMGARKLRYRSMNGTLLQPKSFEYSRTHDLVRMRLDEAAITDLSVLKFSKAMPRIDEEILIYGNSAGGGVATELEGEIVGVGPADIEVTAKMVPGNSGSPIINHQGEVLGVATYATFSRNFKKGSVSDQAFKGSRFNKTRRYGVRIPEGGWVSGSLSAYLRQSYQLEDMQTYLGAIYILHQYWQGNKSLADTVNRMYIAYGGIGENDDEIFEFNAKETEELLRRTVRSFKLSHESIIDLSSKRTLSDTEYQAARIARLLAKGVEEIKVSADRNHWKSNLLKTEAKMIEEMAMELLSQIKSSKDPYEKKQKSGRNR